MSHLLVISRVQLTTSPAVDTQAALTALGVLAEAGVYDTGPHGTERLMVVDSGELAAIQATAARSRQ